MKSPPVQRNVNAVRSGSRRLLIEWSEGEGFCLNARASIEPKNQSQKERDHYVKLVIDLPYYRTLSSPVWVCGDRRNGGVDRPGLIRSLPRLVSRVAHFWTQKRDVKPAGYTNHEREGI